MPFGVYERNGSSYSLKKCFSLATDVFHTTSFSSFLGTLAAPCAAPKGGRCIDDQGWPTPIPGCYSGSFCQDRPSPGLCWDLPVSMVKGWLGASSTDALVANITPNLNTAQLAEIVGIWGYYYPCWTSKVGPWTVIMLKLKMLWVDTIPGSGWIRPTTVPPNCNPRIAIKMWDKFPVPPKPGRSTFEFFYATYNGGTWKMQGHGLYNAPILYPDALDCFFRIICQELKKSPSDCGEGLDLCKCVCNGSC